VITRSLSVRVFRPLSHVVQSDESFLVDDDHESIRHSSSCWLAMLEQDGDLRFRRPSGSGGDIFEVRFAMT
jgi:hypothetical protein